MISLRYLHSRIEPYIVSERLSKGWNTQPFEIAFLGSKGHLRSQRLYIASSKDLVKEVTADKDSALIVCDADTSTPKHGPDGNIYVSLSCRRSVVYDIIDEMTEFSRDIDQQLTAVSGSGAVSEVCELAARAAHGACALVDRQGSIISLESYSEEEPGEGGDDDFTIVGQHSLERAIKGLENVNCPIGDSVPIPDTGHELYGHVIGTDDAVEGYLFVESAGRDRDCLAVVTKCAHFLEKHFSAGGLLMPDARTLDFSKTWEQIAKRRMISSKAISQAFASAPFPMRPFVNVGLVVFDEAEPRRSLSYIVDTLKILIPQTNFALFDDEIVFCPSTDAREERIQFSREEELNSFLLKTGIRLFLSSATRRYDGLYSLYQMTKRTGQLLQPLGVLTEDQRIVFAQDYDTYYIVDLAIRKFLSSPGNDDVNYLIKPSIVVLTRYDREHNSNLRETLYQFLLNDCNLVQTAKSTFMHRNTVFNKINKVKKLTGINLDNPLLRQRLLLSCQFALYEENILGREIP